MPKLRTPLPFKEAPSPGRRAVRLIALVLITCTIFIFGLAILVVAVTD